MDREVNFWGRIVTALWAPNRMLARIENGVMDGMPDTYIVLERSMNWVELKAPVEPVRQTTALFSGNHKLSISQRNWLLSHRQAGGRGWIAIESERFVWLVGAKHADRINDATIEQMHELATFTGRRPMSEASWLEFKEALLQKEIP